MPLHSYKHEVTKGKKPECTHEEELLFKMSDEVPRTLECPVCEGTLHKQFGGCSFHLKGRGWYKDGYQGGK